MKSLCAIITFCYNTIDLNNEALLTFFSRCFPSLRLPSSFCLGVFGCCQISSSMEKKKNNLTENHQTETHCGSFAKIKK